MPYTFDPASFGGLPFADRVKSEEDAKILRDTLAKYGSFDLSKDSGAGRLELTGKDGKSIGTTDKQSYINAINRDYTDTVEKKRVADAQAARAPYDAMYGQVGSALEELGVRKGTPQYARLISKYTGPGSNLFAGGESNAYTTLRNAIAEDSYTLGKRASADSQFYADYAAIKDAETAKATKSIYDGIRASTTAAGGVFGGVSGSQGSGSRAGYSPQFDPYSNEAIQQLEQYRQQAKGRYGEVNALDEAEWKRTGQFSDNNAAYAYQSKLQEGARAKAYNEQLKEKEALMMDRKNIVFDPRTGNAIQYKGADGQVYGTNGMDWKDVSKQGRAGQLKPLSNELKPAGYGGATGAAPRRSTNTYFF